MVIDEFYKWFEESYLQLIMHKTTDIMILEDKPTHMKSHPLGVRWYLGMTVDSELNFGANSGAMCKKSGTRDCFVLGNIDKAMTNTFYHTFIKSILLFLSFKGQNPNC